MKPSVSAREGGECDLATIWSSKSSMCQDYTAIALVLYHCTAYQSMHLSRYKGQSALEQSHIA